MHRHHLDADDAFGSLARASQNLNVKLRAVADIVVETAIDATQSPDLARRAAKDAGERIDELRYRRAAPVVGGRPAGEALADAERRTKMAVARAVYRLGETAARQFPAANEETPPEGSP